MNDLLRGIGANLRLLGWAFLMALAVWVAAITTADPDEVRTLPAAVPVEIVGQDTGLVIVGSVPRQVTVTLRAPRSIWEQLTADPTLVRAVLSLSDLDAGQHRIEIQVQVGVRPARVVTVTPATVDLTLEELISRPLAVDLVLTGQPAVGYRADVATANPVEVIISGPRSQVELVERVRVSVNLDGIRESLDQYLTPQLLDANSQPLTGLSVSPEQVHVSLPVSQLGGYRDTAVKVVVIGQVASGYRLSNLTVFPLVVTLYSDDPTRVAALPGYIETVAIDLNGAKDDLTLRVALNLPSGVSVVGEQTVLVQVGINPIEGSLTLRSRQVEVTGLGANLQATIAPTTLDVILSGPLPLLDQLTAQDVRVLVDLSGLTPGIHQLTPTVEILLSDLRVESLLPATVEVVITRP